MNFPRSAGILLHISSLPGPVGIGDLGPAAHDFARFLKEAGQTIWQILPLCPPANGNSPYSSFSAFATNSNLISLDAMIERGWGTQDDLQAATDESDCQLIDSSEVDFEAAQAIRSIFFRRAFENLKSSLPDNEEYQSFCHANDDWLDDFSLFESIARSRNQFDWCRWPRGLAKREPGAIELFRQEHQSEIEFSRFLQFVFECQWRELKGLCAELGIRVYGDLPIFVDHQSSDVWANQDQFQLNANGSPESVAGVPPDYFSPTGQKWGNPLYRWDVMEKDGYAWWTRRFRRALQQFDIIRVDHFRGFEAYYQIPATAPSAKTGEWIKGPGAKPFNAAERELGEMPIVAEDLGLITEEVNLLRDELGFPTMRVMQFGYGSLKDNFHRPSHYPNHCFAYTGTHDNDTIMGWYQEHLESAAEEIRELLLDQFGRPGENGIQANKDRPVHLKLIDAVLASDADTAIIPIQDYLGLGNEARINLPATAEGNWKWKLSEDDSYGKLASTILEMTVRSSRV